MHHQRWRKRGTTALPRKLTTQERFWAKVDKDGPVPEHAPDLGACWVWTGYGDDKGYGSFNRGDRTMGAHRWAWIDANGPVPDGLHLDHLCWNPSCVRPDHLEPVTPAENAKRGEWGRRTHCPHGHPYTPENTRVAMKNGRPARLCRECQRIYMRRYSQRKRERTITTAP